VPDADAGSARAGSRLGATGWPYALTPLIPLALVLNFVVVDADETLLFLTSALGVIPGAAMTGRATEELVRRTGAGIGGLMNVTFGNLPELIIAFIALTAGLYEVVKAWVIGSVLGNVLLVLGISMLVGGLRNREQSFSAKAASAQAMMLFVAGVGLLIPATLFAISGGSLPVPGEQEPPFGADIETVSLLVALILLGTYAGGLLFSLRTHQHLFNPRAESADDDEVGRQPWSVRKAVLCLAVAGVAVALMAEIFVESIAPTAERIGVSQFFISVIVVAVVGNSAEHWVAVLMAYRNKINLAVNISIGSGAQVALFVAPLLVVLSFFYGPAPMPLVFNALEIAGMLLAVFIASFVTKSGESTWFEGLMLVTVYTVLAISFFFA
jgi:Ca2+:H+ antiporter